MLFFILVILSFYPSSSYYYHYYYCYYYYYYYYYSSPSSSTCSFFNILFINSHSLLNILITDTNYFDRRVVLFIAIMFWSIATSAAGMATNLTQLVDRSSHILLYFIKCFYLTNVGKWMTSLIRTYIRTYSTYSTRGRIPKNGWIRCLIHSFGVKFPFFSNSSLFYPLYFIFSYLLCTCICICICSALRMYGRCLSGH